MPTRTPISLLNVTTSFQPNLLANTNSRAIYSLMMFRQRFYYKNLRWTGQAQLSLKIVQKILLCTCSVHTIIIGTTTTTCHQNQENKQVQQSISEMILSEDWWGLTTSWPLPVHDIKDQNTTKANLVRRKKQENNFHHTVTKPFIILENKKEILSHSTQGVILHYLLGWTFFSIFHSLSFILKHETL
jgi:hypothetical protein